ncbi:MAG: helix-turn-helix domain-containing protein [Flavobacteriaceae bacterium]|nr:helix-turn-helix domain-containing protein [Flavobacteriaceae bacterium]
MKQPELGKKISELRKAKGITQEELVEKCNLNVRTIQRIEAGEVTPRSYTIKTILTALEYNFSDITTINYSQTSIKFLKLAWIFGIVYFMLGFFELFAEYYRYTEDEMIFSKPVYIAIKLAVLISYSIFIYGFVTIGDILKNYILKIIAFILMIVFILVIVYDMISIFFSPLPHETVLIIEAVTFGGIQLIFGIALLKLQKTIGNIALAAGILEILTGALFLSVILSLVGLITYLPAILLEVVILYKTYEYVKVGSL